jgi:hypothetical protein
MKEKPMNPTLPSHVILHGTPDALSTVRRLRAGPLTLSYQRGELRYIRLGDREIIRRLYVAVRDRYWGTVPGIIRDEHIDQHEDSFTIRFTSEHQQGEIRFVWHAQIEGHADGSVSFAMAGEALSSFLRNRIGFCVLHPLRECMGTAAAIYHVDGTTSQAQFPELIAPQRVIDGVIQPVYPFAEMRSLRHAVTAAVAVEITFTGETFEMEDQRNWIDASYKTYGTPLRLPWPVRLEAGDRVNQQVSLALIGEPPRLTEALHTETTVTLSDQTAALPAIGLCAADHDEALSEQAVSRLRTLNLSHLRVDIRLFEDYAATLARAQHEASLLGIRLELALTVSDNAEAELSEIAQQLSGLPLMNALIFHFNELSTSARWLTMARTIFRKQQLTIPIYGGTNAYFTHINAQHPPTDVLDGVVYSVNPQVHASDDLSVMETCEAIPATIQTAQSLTANKPLALSTLTLKPRFNPYDTGNRAPEPGQLPAQVDVRQLSLLGAAWTLGSLKAIAESGLTYLTCYATTGWCGLMERASGSPLPKIFPSIPGAVFPLYHVLADIAEFTGGEVVVSHSSTPQQVSTLALRKGSKQRLLLANLTSEPRTVQFKVPEAIFRMLDESCATEAMTTPETWRSQRQPWPGDCTLPPYAYLCLDISCNLTAPTSSVSPKNQRV